MPGQRRSSEQEPQAQLAKQHDVQHDKHDFQNDSGFPHVFSPYAARPAGSNSTPTARKLSNYDC